jgi:phospholipase C
VRISRRKLLAGAAAGAALAPLAAERTVSAAQTSAALPTPEESGIDHVVVVMMENRSFDHFLGWVPGADGRQAGLTYLDPAGVAHSTYPLAPDYQGCGHPDPDHSYAGGRVEYNNGACDGWLRAGSNDEFAIGYYEQKDLAFLGKAVPEWTTFSRYFSAILSATYPNRIYQHAAQTDRLSNTSTTCTLPTIWDRLADKGLSGRYYFGDLPFLALWGAKYIPISRSFATFFEDCAAGTLPNVSYVDPRFLDESSGTSGDDHPHADIRNGEAFLNAIYEAVTTSPAWPRTALVFNYDEWGGFFEHVPPPTAPIPTADVAAGNADGLLGFRVPCLIVSPFAPRERVSHVPFDHTSVLRMIEWRWNLPPLSVRDATANNLAEALDFRAPSLRAKQFSVPPGPFGEACSLSGRAIEMDKWEQLRIMASTFGWPA